MKWDKGPRRTLIDEQGREYTIIMLKIPNDYIYYANVYRSKNGKTYGNWTRVGHYTTISNAIRGLRRLYKDRKFEIVKRS